MRRGGCAAGCCWRSSKRKARKTTSKREAWLTLRGRRRRTDRGRTGRRAGGTRPHRPRPGIPGDRPGHSAGHPGHSLLRGCCPPSLRFSRLTPNGRCGTSAWRIRMDAKVTRASTTRAWRSRYWRPRRCPNDVLGRAGVAASPAAKCAQFGAGRRQNPAASSSMSNLAVRVAAPGVFADRRHGRLERVGRRRGPEVLHLLQSSRDGTVAKVIRAAINGHPAPGVSSTGITATSRTIGRLAAVVEVRRLRLWGAPAWWLWGFTHVLLLAGGRNRATVVLNWLWAYLTYRRGTRLITRSMRRTPQAISRGGCSWAISDRRSGAILVRIFLKFRTVAVLPEAVAHLESVLGEGRGLGLHRRSKGTELWGYAGSIRTLERSRGLEEQCQRATHAPTLRLDPATSHRLVFR